MATKTLNTRIKLKRDTLANWTSANPVLLQGEVAVVEIPSGQTSQTVSTNGITPPQVLFKVGDGTTAFNSLPYATALAGDVHSWAKLSDTPTNTQYRIVQKSSGSNEFYLFGKNVTFASGGNADTLSSTGEPVWNSGTNTWTLNGWTLIDTLTVTGHTYTLNTDNTAGNAQNGTLTLKDESGTESTAKVKGIKGAAFEDVASTISSSDTGLARASQVKFYVDDAVSSVDGMSIVIAWKGDAAPVVANIPQGVVVHYNDTDYTGTLAAASSTMRKMYLVYNNNGTKDIYDEYITVRTGTSPSYTYTWEKIGDTGIDLSNYVTTTQLTNTINGLDGVANGNGEWPDPFPTAPDYAGKIEVLYKVQEVNGIIQDVDNDSDATTASKSIMLEHLAKTANVNDLKQTSGDYLIFDCGTSTTVI